MKKYFNFLFIGLFCSAVAFSTSNSYHQEAEMHYTIARECYKNGRLNECARLLHEIIGYYDMEYFDAYKLLVKVYAKLGEIEKQKEIKKRFIEIKKLKKIRAKKKGKTLSPFEVLKIGYPEEKIKACAVLGENLEDEAIPYLIEVFNDPYYNYYHGVYEVREAASDSLAKFEDKVLPYLFEAFSSSDEVLRLWSFKTLRKIKKTSQKIKNIFHKALNDTSKDVKLAAIKGIMEKKDMEAIPMLIPLLNDGNKEVEYFSALAISEMSIKKGDKYYKKVISILLKKIECKDKLIASQSIKLLAKIGGEEVTESLLKIGEDENRDTFVRWYAIKGLGTILSKKDVTLLEKFLDSENFWLKSAAAVALGKPAVRRKVSRDVLKKKKEVIDETALKFSLTSDIVYEEARLQGINKALDYLESIQKENGEIPSPSAPLGATQLAVLCFQKQGYKEDYPVIRKGIDYILKYQKEGGFFYSEDAAAGKKKTVFTTSLSVRILSNTHKVKYRLIIKDALIWLKEIQNPDGGFGYYKGSRSDITCTVFALLALERGYDYWGWKKSDETWIKAAQYLKNMQNSDGGFGYTKEMQKNSYGSATASGLIGLLLSETDIKLTDKTLKWISENYTWEKNPHAKDNEKYKYNYYIQELAKALHLSGKEVIKDKDGKEHSWHDEVLKKVLSEQHQNGWWVTEKEPIVTTFFIEVLQLKRLNQSLSGL